LAKEKYLLKSNVQLRAATAQKDLATVELKRVKELAAKDAASQSELEKAEMELTVAGLKEELARRRPSPSGWRSASSSFRSRG
jgi:multidrug resistance efflux pump